MAIHLRNRDTLPWAVLDEFENLTAQLNAYLDATTTAPSGDSSVAIKGVVRRATALYPLEPSGRDVLRYVAAKKGSNRSRSRA